MRNWFFRIIDKIRFALSQCYGNDELNIFLYILALVTMLLGFIPYMYFLTLVSFLLLIYCNYRCFSRNVYKRLNERNAFLRVKRKVKSKISLRKLIFNERKTHVYFKCKRCKALLRVPKGRGEIVVTCRECGEKIDKKT